MTITGLCNSCPSFQQFIPRDGKERGLVFLVGPSDMESAANFKFSGSKFCCSACPNMDFSRNCSDMLMKIFSRFECEELTTGIRSSWNGGSYRDDKGTPGPAELVVCLFPKWQLQVTLLISYSCLSNGVRGSLPKSTLMVLAVAQAVCASMGAVQDHPETLWTSSKWTVVVDTHVGRYDIWVPTIHFWFKWCPLPHFENETAI